MKSIIFLAIFILLNIPAAQKSHKDMRAAKKAYENAIEDIKSVQTDYGILNARPEVEEWNAIEDAPELNK